jgi:hypothetical protein
VLADEVHAARACSHGRRPPEYRAERFHGRRGV